MIPEFPEFKLIELSDREDVEKITYKYPPYSDFNFTSMWSWDIKREMKLSMLNSNLVVRFTDYVTGKMFYSFLGNNDVNKTAATLLDLSKKEGLAEELKLLPEDSIKCLDKNLFKLEEDKDHNDYVIQISILKEYNTPQTRSRRKSVKNILSKFKPEIKLLDLSDIDQQKSVLKLVVEKSKSDSDVTDNELLAISRFITGHQNVNFLSMGMFINSEMVGFIFSEVLNSKFATAHFWKANTTVSQHIYAYLMQQKAKLLHEHGCEFMNIEQDLGIGNLRKWKQSYSSEIFLKKFTITQKL